MILNHVTKSKEWQGVKEKRYKCILSLSLSLYIYIYIYIYISMMNYSVDLDVFSPKSSVKDIRLHT